MVRQVYNGVADNDRDLTGGYIGQVTTPFNDAARQI
jgi:hypothetical protein